METNNTCTKVPNNSLSPALLGLSLASPFFAEMLTWKVGIIFPLLLTFHAFTKGVGFPNLRGLPLIAWLIAVIALSHAVALALSDTDYAFNVIKHGLIALMLLVVFVAAYENENKAAIVRYFFIGVAAFSLVLAMLGLVKFGMQDRAIYIKELLVQCQGIYPLGASLCGDYNVQSMMHLVGAIGIIALMPKGKILNWYLVALSLILTAGLLSGSRRFLFLLPVIPIVIMLSGHYAKEPLYKAVASSCITIAMVWSMVFVISAPTEDRQKTRSYEPQYVNVLPWDTDKNVTLLALSDAPPGMILQTVVAGERFGVGTRLDRWSLAINLAESNRFLPMGFSYHEIFSCTFAKCKHIDYPHSTILSALLIGSAPLGLVVLGFYILLAYSILRSGRDGWVNGTSAAILVTAPFSLISGDTLFSIPQMIAVGLLAYVMHRRS